MICYLWGKKLEKGAGEGNQDYHPLLFHLLDVAAVTACLWDQVLGRRVREFLSNRLSLPPDQARNWLAFWAGLHDLGKATPAFQGKWPVARDKLTSAGLPFPSNPIPKPHGLLTAVCLPKLLRQHWPSLDPDLAQRLAVALGGHHGIFPQADELNSVTRQSIGGYTKWHQLRRSLVELHAALCGVAELEPPRLVAVDHAFFLFLAGLASVADWIGSNTDFFPFAPPGIEPELYFHQAQSQAQRALQDLGWLGWRASDQVLTMPELFPFLREVGLRPLQEAVAGMASQLAHQGLVLLEAPMGEGKTEAALFLADHWTTVLGQRGCYVALPTMATSNQMFSRVKDFLARRYPQEIVNLQLLHGHASLTAEFQVLRQRADRLFAPNCLEAEREDGEPDQRGAVLAAEWFTHRKRGLLAPFGVGTVDQALLAVLNTRHFFVRLFGLAGKTVIIDEVHAYDAYMLKLLERLLAWLAALGCSVVLLSATLPAARRQALLAAYAKGLGLPNLRIDCTDRPYPRLSLVSARAADCCHFPASPSSSRKLALAWIEAGSTTPASLVNILGPKLQQALAQGGCAAVLCNTVARAQEVYVGLKTFFSQADAGDGWPELDLLHARYPFAEREARELRALTRFGKSGARVVSGDGIVQEVRRPRRAVLVATQIIEQSLDLDFDLLVSDLAPVDLLLQRSGRLHRHNRHRPACLSQPALWLLAPPAPDGVPAFDPGTARVYDLHILLRSWLALRDRSTIAIPDEVETLIEAVYGKTLPPQTLTAALQEVWKNTQEQLRRAIQDEEFQARNRYIRPPDFADDITQTTGEVLAEDAPELHPSLQAATRLAGPSVTVILLYERDGVLYDITPESDKVDILISPDAEQVRRLLRSSVTLTHPGLARLLLKKEEAIPRTWQRHPLLCHCRLLRLDAQGCWRDDRYEIRLDKDLGVVINCGIEEDV